MISYRKDEIDDLAHAVGRHWGGQACDWRLVVAARPRTAAPKVELHVEIALGGCLRITTIPLGYPAGDNASQSTEHDGARTMATVYRTSVQSLLAHMSGGNVEPLLDYLRGCGIRVMD